MIILKQPISDINQTCSQGFVVAESSLSVFSKKERDIDIFIITRRRMSLLSENGHLDPLRNH